MKKRICIVSTVSSTPKAFMLPHLALLTKEFEVTLVSNFATDEQKLFLAENIGVANCFQIPFERKISVVQDGITLVQLYRYFRKSKFDYILSMTPKAGLLTALAGVGAGAKEVIHLFTGQVWANKQGVYRKFLMGLDWLVGKLNSRILVDGLAQRNYLVSVGVVPESAQILGTKNSMASIDTVRFSPNAALRNELRLHYALSDSIVLFFLGRLNKDKGIYELVEAYASLKKDFPTLKLFIAGNDEEDVIPTIVTDRGELSALDIYYLGAVSNPEHYLQLADIFVLPSHREGFGCSVAEASACALPVVCSDIWGLTDAYIDNKTGIKFKVNCVNSLAEALTSLIVSSSVRSQLGENGRNYVLEHFDQQKIAKAWLEFFSKLNELHDSSN